jgi:hypothetical protein
MFLHTVDLTTVFFNPLERPLKNFSIGNSEAKTNLTTKHKVQLYNYNYFFHDLLEWKNMLIHRALLYDSALFTNAL